MTDFLDGKVKIRYPDRLFIGGEWVAAASSERIELVSPVSEQVFGTVAAAGRGDTEKAVAAAREAFDNGPWPRLPVAERRRYLELLIAELTARTDELAHAWTGQVGALYPFAQGGTAMSIGLLQFQADIAEQHVWEEKRPTMYPDNIGIVVREPIGVVAAIAPWNAPLFSLLIKAGPALIAGCTLVLKPSPETPLEAYILCECVEAAGFPPGVVNMITAERDVSDYLVQQPGIDQVSFTGSTVAGKRIGSVCAERIARCTLELGGKSPAILLDDFDIEQATSILAPTLTMLSGQVCSNLTRYLVPRGSHDDFVESLAAKLRQIVVGDPNDPLTGMGPLAMKRQLERVEGYVRTGIDQGATLVTGGRRPAHLNSGYYFEPTLFANVDNRSTIAQEEIFGPVVCVTPYEDVDDAIRLANETSFGLAGAVFTNDSQAAYRVARAVKAGSIGQNGLKPDFNIAFGGYKQSGIGREGGLDAIEHYLEIKTLVFEKDFERI
jgi:acyl-CoA reductase-like NAD-dependent aldehyde dehydrogenase